MEPIILYMPYSSLRNPRTISYSYFLFLLVSSAVGHGHDNTPIYPILKSRKKKMCRSPPPPPPPRWATFAGAKLLCLRSSSETFCNLPPPPLSKHGARPCSYFNINLQLLIQRNYISCIIYHSNLNNIHFEMVSAFTVTAVLHYCWSKILHRHSFCSENV